MHENNHQLEKITSFFCVLSNDMLFDPPEGPLPPLVEGSVL